MSDVQYFQIQLGRTLLEGFDMGEPIGVPTWEIVDKLNAKITDLNDKLEILQERLSEVQSLFSLPPINSKPLKPSWLGGIILGLLYRRGYATHDSIRIIARSYGDVELSRNYISVAVHELRKKLKPHGITIETQSDQGFTMTEAAKRRLDDVGYVLVEPKRRYYK